KERGRTARQKVLDFIESNLSFSQTLEELFRNARSEMALYFEDKVRVASNAYTDAMISWKKRFRADMKAIFGVDKVRELNLRLAELAKPKDTGVELVEGRVTKVEEVPVET